MLHYDAHRDRGPIARRALIRDVERALKGLQLPLRPLYQVQPVMDIICEVHGVGELISREDGERVWYFSYFIDTFDHFVHKMFDVPLKRRVSDIPSTHWQDVMKDQCLTSQIIAIRDYLKALKKVDRLATKLGR